MTLSGIDSAGGDYLPGYDVYLGYVDYTPGGHTATFPAAAEMAKSQNAKALSVTTDADLTAEVFDIETGAEQISTAPRFFAKQTTQRPIFYVGVRSVDTLVAVLARVGVGRKEFRVISAHYGWTPAEHICGPQTCGYCSTPCDGTQWAGTAGGTDSYDLDVLVTGFFDTLTEEATLTVGIVEYTNALYAVFVTQGQVKKRHLGAETVETLTALGAKRLKGAPWTTNVIAQLPVVA